MEKAQDRPSSKSSARAGSSDNPRQQTGEKSSSRPSSRSSTRSMECLLAGTSRSELQASTSKTRSAAAPQSSGDSHMVAGEPQVAAGGSQRAAGDSQLWAEGPPRAIRRPPKAEGVAQKRESLKRPNTPSRKSERLTLSVQSVSVKMNELQISRKSEGAQEQPKKLKFEGRKSQPGGAGAKKSPYRSSGPGGETKVNAEKLVLSAMGDLKSSKSGASRRGISLAAIQRHIADKLGARAAHWRPYVRIYLRKALNAGKFVHVKGKGLTGFIKVASGKDDKSRKKSKPKASPKKAAKPRASPKASTMSRATPKKSSTTRASPKKPSKLSKKIPARKEAPRRQGMAHRPSRRSNQNR